MLLNISVGKNVNVFRFCGIISKYTESSNKQLSQVLYICVYIHVIDSKYNKKIYAISLALRRIWETGTGKLNHI